MKIMEFKWLCCYLQGGGSLSTNGGTRLLEHLPAYNVGVCVSTTEYFFIAAALIINLPFGSCRPSV